MLISAAFDLAWKIYANHTGKPDGWKPTLEEKIALLNEVEASTPEAIKQEAREQLGIHTPGEQAP